MKIRSALTLMLLAMILTASPAAFSQDQRLSTVAFAKDEKKEANSLTVVNQSGKTTALSAEKFAKLPRQTVKVKDHSGTAVSYEGVSLAEILRLAGVTFGKDLKGPLLANCLLAEAVDGYRVVFALPEIDPAMTDNIILLADRKDGQPLDAKQGPYKVIVPHEKRPSRWVRQVIKLSIVHAGESPKQKP